METTPRSDVLDAARSALAHMERLGESGWCLCVSASAPTEVEEALRDLIKLVEAEHPEPEMEYAHAANGYWNDDETEFTAEEYLDVSGDARGALAGRRAAGPWLPVGMGEQ